MATGMQRNTVQDVHIPETPTGMVCSHPHPPGHSGRSLHATGILAEKRMALTGTGNYINLMAVVYLSPGMLYPPAACCL